MSLTTNPRRTRRRIPLLVLGCAAVALAASPPAATADSKFGQKVKTVWNKLRRPTAPRPAGDAALKTKSVAAKPAVPAAKARPAAAQQAVAGKAPPGLFKPVAPGGKPMGVASAAQSIARSAAPSQWSRPLPPSAPVRAPLSEGVSFRNLPVVKLPGSVADVPRRGRVDGGYQKLPPLGPGGGAVPGRNVVRTPEGYSKMPGGPAGTYDRVPTPQYDKVPPLPTAERISGRPVYDRVREIYGPLPPLASAAYAPAPLASELAVRGAPAGTYGPVPPSNRFAGRPSDRQQYGPVPTPDQIARRHYGQVPPADRVASPPYGPVPGADRIGRPAYGPVPASDRVGVLNRQNSVLQNDIYHAPPQAPTGQYVDLKLSPVNRTSESNYQTIKLSPPDNVYQTIKLSPPAPRARVLITVEPPGHYVGLPVRDRPPE